MEEDSFFFVIEGMDGAGKSSIARQLHDALSQAHRNRVALTYEPHDPSAAGRYIRSVLAKQEKASPLALALHLRSTAPTTLTKKLTLFSLLAPGESSSAIAMCFHHSSINQPVA